MNYSKPEAFETALIYVRQGLRDGFGLDDIAVMNDIPREVINGAVQILKDRGEFAGIVRSSVNIYDSRRLAGRRC